MKLFSSDRSLKLYKSRRVLLFKSLLGLLSMSFATYAMAGIFSVTPVRVYMASHERAAAITVTNEGDDELVMQTDIYQWQQTVDGKDLLVLSEDLIMSPPILKMAPRSQQVIRLILLNETSMAQQSTYRMLVSEIPEARPARPDLQLQIAYAFSIPIFVTPVGASAKLDCALSRVSSNSAQAICQNAGTAVAHATGLQLSTLEAETLVVQDTGAYILPGVQRRFVLNRKDGNIPAGKSRLAVSMSDGSSQKFDAYISE
jgi:fimbrial chaperone protein